MLLHHQLQFLTLQQSHYDALPTYYNNTLGSYYPFGGYTEGDGLVYPIKPVGYNADLKWETTTTYNAGLDLGFLDGRITASADFYYRETKDLLNFTPVPAGANLTNYLNANIGDLKNIGAEFEINAIAIQSQDWYWNIGANVAWNKNEITRLTNDDEAEGYYGVDTGGYSGGVGGTCQVHQTGHSDTLLPPARIRRHEYRSGTARDPPATWATSKSTRSSRRHSF